MSYIEDNIDTGILEEPEDKPKTKETYDLREAFHEYKTYKINDRWYVEEKDYLKLKAEIERLKTSIDELEFTNILREKLPPNDMMDKIKEFIKEKVRK